jgi:hypothetical protein
MQLSCAKDLTESYVQMYEIFTQRSGYQHEDLKKTISLVSLKVPLVLGYGCFKIYQIVSIGYNKLQLESGANHWPISLAPMNEESVWLAEQKPNGKKLVPGVVK